MAGLELDPGSPAPAHWGTRSDRLIEKGGRVDNAEPGQMEAWMHLGSRAARELAHWAAAFVEGSNNLSPALFHKT